MSTPTVIRSRANPIIKRATAALAGKERGTLVLEGERLIDDAVGAGVSIELVLVSDERPDLARLADDAAELRFVGADLLQQISLLKTSPGVLALCGAPSAQEPESWRRDARSLWLVVAGVSDPGNLGALARSAEALGAQALLATAGGANPWSPRALRGSMGSLLRLPVAAGLAPDEIAQRLAALGVRQVRAATRDGVDAASFDWTGPVALWVSGETGRLPPATVGFEAVTIAMAGRSESLNVTVATSLLLYASGRVRPTNRDG